ncbi:hypothetical protein BH09VER1_BH09VER1_28620 [soil metagenome]
MPASLQLDFDFLLSHTCPLLTVDESAFVLSLGKDATLSLLDLGLIRAIDIALQLNGTRRELRFWRWTILHRSMRPELPLGSVGIAETMPHSRPVWRAGEVAAWLRCSEDHVWNLWDHSHLTGPQANAGTGRTGKSRMIYRDSLITFAREREVK